MQQASAFLLIHHAPDAVQEVALHGGSVVIGRAAPCDVVLSGRLVSRRHARISANGHGYTIEDLGSRNGTFVNGSRLIGAQQLQNGDRIECGGQGLVCFVDNDATSTRVQAPSTGVWLDRDTEEVWVDGVCLSPPLSAVQFTLLRFLDDHRDQICSRTAIIATVWPQVQEGVSDEAIDALVKRVRGRLAETPHGQRYLVTVRGRGLILQSPEKVAQR